jgi:outer membrane immunogenic protein
MTITAPARSADRATPVLKAPPAAAAYNWSGFYAGIHAGMGHAENGFVDLSNGLEVAVFTANGVLGGLQGGFNWQHGPWVLGGELEGSLSHLERGVSGTCVLGLGGQVICFGTCVIGLGGIPICFGGGGAGGVCTPVGPGINNCGGVFGARVHKLGLMTAHAGYAFDRWLGYVKGGLAVAEERYVVNIPGLVAAAPVDSRFGWVVGGGIEYGLDANWSAKLEYNYVDFGTEQLTLPVPGGAAVPLEHEQRLHLVKLGVNYRFGRTN